MINRSTKAQFSTSACLFLHSPLMESNNLPLLLGTLSLFLLEKGSLFKKANFSHSLSSGYHLILKDYGSQSLKRSLCF